MKHKIPIAALALFLTQPARGADFQEQLAQLRATGGDTEVREFIERSYDANKDNPAYYVAAANYWWSLAQTPNVSTKPSGGGDFSVTDPNTGKEVGSLSTTGRVDTSIPAKAIELLREAARRFPHRIDIGIGLAHILRTQGRHRECVVALEAVLKNSKEQQEKLQWQNGKPLSEPPDTAIPALLQGYTAGLYQMDTGEGDELCRALCESITDTYPDHPYAYNILAALSSAQKDDKSCLKYLLIAHEKAPDDPLVILNLADTYRKVGDRDSARRFYELVLSKNPSPDDKAQIEAAIAELESQPAEPAPK